MGTRRTLDAAAIAIAMLIVPATTAGWASDDLARATAQEAELGALSIDAASSGVASNSVITVRIGNTGGGPVTDVAIRTSAPGGVTATALPASVPSIAANSSVLVVVHVEGSPAGRPAHIEITATGTTGGQPTAALASVELEETEPAVTLTVVGDTSLTDESPADLIGVVENRGTVPASVKLTGYAGQHAVLLGLPETEQAEGPLEVDVAPMAAAQVLIRVQSKPPVRRGTAALVVTATVKTALVPDTTPSEATQDPEESSGASAEGVSEVQTYQVVSTTSLDATLSADAIPEALGLSVVVIPGVAGVWAALAVWYRDRRRLGIATTTAGSKLWENKLWLFLGVAATILVSFVGTWLGIPSMLDAYTVSSLIAATIVSVAIGAAVGGVVVWVHRSRVPRITQESLPVDLLEAAESADPALSRRLYRTTDGKLGLFVQQDRDAIVLTPQIAMTEMDNVSHLVDKDAPLADVLNQIRQDKKSGNLWYILTDRTVDRPIAVVGAIATGISEKILDNRRAPEKKRG